MRSSGFQARWPQSAAQVTSIFSFNGTNGNGPAADLLRLANGLMYGTTEYGGATTNGTVFVFNPAAMSIVSEFSFSGTNGYGPTCALIQGQDGNLYGTTGFGSAGFGDGTVFRISSDLLSFTSLHTNVGVAGPSTSLIQWTNGYLFGVTFGGGNGEGTWFSITTNGVLEDTFPFGGVNASTIGGHPVASLTMGTDGTLYGTTTHLGAGGDGTIFSISSGSNFSTLLAFKGTNGSHPQAPLLMASDGYLYGTTYTNGAYGYGTVFRFNPTNDAPTTLYSFANGTDGGYPVGRLVEVTSGVFYGTTSSTNGGIYQITSGGAFSIVAALSGTNGNSSRGGLVRGTNGNFYGTTTLGGTYGLGTIFQLSTLDATPPIFQKPVIANGMFSVAATAVTGQSYQLQYKTNLTQLNWINSGGPITASNGVISISDAVAGSGRFLPRPVGAMTLRMDFAGLVSGCCRRTCLSIDAGEIF